MLRINKNNKGLHGLIGEAALSRTERVSLRMTSGSLLHANIMTSQGALYAVIPKFWVSEEVCWSYFVTSRCASCSHTCGQNARFGSFCVCIVLLTSRYTMSFFIISKEQHYFIFCERSETVLGN